MLKAKKNGITAVVLTHNEEKNINNCLSHLAWTDRIIIVDSGSIDKTIQHAMKFGCSVHSNPWNGYADQRR